MVNQLKRGNAMKQRIMAPLEMTIEEVKSNGISLGVKTIEMKAIARMESGGHYNETCGACVKVRPDLKQVCERAGVDPADCLDMLKFEIEGIWVVPNFKVKVDFVDVAIKFAETAGLPKPWFIFYCIYFGIFQLDSAEVMSEYGDLKAGFDALYAMVSSPHLQVIEFARQFRAYSEIRGGEFRERAHYWRTREWEVKPLSYGDYVQRYYNELRIMGHADC